MQVKKPGKTNPQIQILFLYFGVWPLHSQGCHDNFGIHYSNLNDFAASTCSHSLCWASGGKDIEEPGDLLICN